MSTVSADAALADFEEILLKEVFNNEIKSPPHVRFGPVRRHDNFQFCPNVRRTANDCGHEIIISENIANDRERVSMALQTGLIIALAMQHGVKISCKSGATKETDDYTGQYRNKRFKEYGERYGLIIKNTGNDYGFQPIGVSDNIKQILANHHIGFSATREKLLYGTVRSSNNGFKCICPQCGRINYYEKKKQRLYCSDCLDSLAAKHLGDLWDSFLYTYGKDFTIVRATET